MMRFFQSMRWRVQMWQSLLLGLVLGALGVLFFQHERQVAMREIDHVLQRSVPMFLPRISVAGSDFSGPGSHRRKGPPRGDGMHPKGPPPRGDGTDRHEEGKGLPPHRDESGMLTLRRDGELSELLGNTPIYFAIWDNNGHVLKSENAPSGIESIAGLNYQGPSELRTFQGNREAYDATPHLACIIVGMDLDTMQSQLSDLKRRIVFMGGGFWLAGTLVGWWLGGIAVRPFEEMRKTAGRVASGDLAARIPGDFGKSETGELADDLNQTFAALERSFEHQRRFTADASHELRSPIAAMMSETQVALRRERDAGSYRAALEVVDGNLRKMNDLATGLLDLAKLDSGEMKLSKTRVDLAELAESALDLLHGLIEKRKTPLETDLKPACCQGDAEKLGQVIVNLLSNAILHSPHGTKVKVTSGSGEGIAWLAVVDEGAGIPEEHLPHIFQRFYRGDQARKQDEGSTGLGLAIAKGIVDAHGGRISVESRVGKGSRFVLKLET